MQLGINDQPVNQVGGWTQDPGLIATTGAAWARLPLNWFDVEPTNGTYNDPHVAIQLATYNAAGLKVLFTVINTPNWANGNGGQNVPPTNPADFATLMAHLVTSFPGQAWEIYNEVDGNLEFLPGGQTAAQALGGSANYAARMAYYAVPYVAMVNAAYTAMKAVDPNCTVIAGVQSTLDPTFYQACMTAGMAGHFDAYSVHSYGNPIGTPDPTTFFGPLLDTFQAARAALSDTTPLWLTEFGWISYPDSLDDPPLAGMVTDTQAAAWSLAYLTGLYARGDIPVAMIYILRDARLLPTGIDGTDKPGYYGVMSQECAPKNAYYALQNLFAPQRFTFNNGIRYRYITPPSS